MKYLDLTLPTPAQNLALDEALFEACEAGLGSEVLRFWEPQGYFVVVGYANRIRQAVNLEACQAAEVPVLRRCSGGGAVLQGPGCLNYSLVLRISGPLAGITETNQWIMQQHRAVLQTLLAKPVAVQGATDLTTGQLKFSGNAQRRKRSSLLFHGTFLLKMDLARIASLLPRPLQQPAYRQNRPHGEFLTNLKLSSAILKQTLQQNWDANEPYGPVPFTEINRLVVEKYALEDWNYR